MIQITRGNADRPARFEDQVIFLSQVIWDEAVSNATRDNDVIFGAVTQFAERALQRSPTLENEDDFVGAAVPVILEFAVGLLGLLPIGNHVLVEEHRDPAGIKI